MNPAYLDTYFLGSSTLESVPEHFFIITACNPMDEKLADYENKLRNERLQNLISKTNCFYVPITGTSRDLSHQEPGFLVETTKQQVIQWGKDFKQRAIFEIQKDKIFILPCFEQLKKIFIGSFAERWLGTTEENML